MSVTPVRAQDPSSKASEFQDETQEQDEEDPAGQAMIRAQVAWSSPRWTGKVLVRLRQITACDVVLSGPVLLLEGPNAQSQYI